MRTNSSARMPPFHSFFLISGGMLSLLLLLHCQLYPRPQALQGGGQAQICLLYTSGITALLMHVDSLIVIPNERLKLISQEKITLMNAFEAADNVLRQGVESISSLINIPAFINLDFADVRSIMKDAGYAHMLSLIHI